MMPGVFVKYLHAISVFNIARVALFSSGRHALRHWPRDMATQNEGATMTELQAAIQEVRKELHLSYSIARATWSVRAIPVRRKVNSPTEPCGNHPPLQRWTFERKHLHLFEARFTSSLLHTVSLPRQGHFRIFRASPSSDLGRSASISRAAWQHLAILLPDALPPSPECILIWVVGSRHKSSEPA
jgi:hypothetical protein